jgi:hypothetical protein
MTAHHPSAASPPTHRSNPFATRHTRPGRLVPLDRFGAPHDVAALLERLVAVDGRAAIRGPHGSGKSTLLEHLARAVERRGTPVVRTRLRSWRDGAVAAATDAAACLRAVAGCPVGGLVCIDGWEQLGPAALVAVGLARLRRCGLVVTTHRHSRLPLLVACATTPALFAAVVHQLPHGGSWHDGVILAADLEAAFARHGGNIREALYELYDRFEERTRAMPR